MSTETDSDAVYSAGDTSVEINLEKYVVEKNDLRGKRRCVKKYYTRQNELIEQIMGDLDPERRLESRGRRSTLPVVISFFVNVFLLIIKLAAAVFSLSLVVIASAVDSLLDILSGLVLFVTSFIAKRKNKYKYPRGRIGMEPIGVVIFSSVMATASFQVLLESLKALVTAIVTRTRYYAQINVWIIAVLVLTVFLKVILYIYCFLLRGNRRTEAVVALQNDHRNDVLTNTLGSIFVIVGFFFRDFWFLDPFGGILYSLYTIYSWATVAVEQIRILTGSNVDQDLHNRIAHVAAKSDSRIIYIEKIKAIETGSGAMVEIHIVLPADMLLEESHAIGESLENKIEMIDDVGICFVHIDYDLNHSLDSEHEKAFYEAVGEKRDKMLIKAARKYRMILVESLKNKTIFRSANASVDSSSFVESSEPSPDLRGEICNELPDSTFGID